MGPRADAARLSAMFGDIPLTDVLIPLIGLPLAAEAQAA